jgi:hypothetical protein
MANEVNPILNIYNEDGTPFHDISLRKHTFSTIVMSLNDKIEGEFYYKDNSLSFTLQEYVEYKGIKYILKNPPVVVRKGMTSENSEAKGMTKYSCTFYHEMIELYNIPFTDIAISSSEESYRSEKRTFSWIGTLSMFVQKINSCLVGTKWTCKLQPTFVDDGTMSDVLSFSNQFISDVCKTAYETWKVPFVVDGYTIWFGKPSKEILDDENKPYIFKFGQGVGLKNNDCTPKNNKVITRIAGYGSNINIPYGYPIITDADGNRIEHPYTRDTLMPSVYVEAVRNKVLFGSKEPLIDYYDADSSYPTPINPLAPVFHIQEFSSIQPTIEGMTYKGQAIDLFKEVIVPEGGWDDYIDPETGEVRQSYFDVTLYPLGFDLYAQAAVTSGMTFSMKSGDTLGANYEVAVDWEDVKKNFYVTDEAGNIVFKPNGEQRDYAKYPDSTDQAITIKLTKDLDTFGTIMPSKFQQVKTGDKFVILHIEMPQAYIDKAQERLDVAMKRYMLENNMPLYDYPLSFDEHFLETNQAILAQIKPNTIVRFLYKDEEEAMALSVKEMSIQYGTNPLPTYNITLTDEVSIVLNQIGQIADGLSKLGSQVAQLQAIYGLDIVGELNKKLSRVKDDTAQGMITFLRGLKVGSFVTGSTGGIFYADTDGKSHAELDYLTVRMKAMFYALEIIKTGVIGGRQMITPGGAIECIKIEDRNDILDEEGNKTGENIWDYWRCYFYQDDGTEALDNRFRAGDMALAQDFNIKEGVYENVSNHYFWRLVVNVGTNYIDISKTDADAASDAPRVGDTICQLGNKTFVDANGVTHVEDKTRQNAIIFSAVDTFSPSMTLYAGINSYSYLNKEYVSYGVDKTTNLAYMNVYGNSYIGARDKSSYMKFDTVTGVEIKGKLVTKSGKDVEETFNSFQDQIDGVKETWYGEYTPTLTNQPAVDWNTEALKKRHEGDVFTNIQEYVDDETTPDAGKSWRWVKTGDTWGWKQIADNDTSKAYLEAAKAQKAAEEAKKEANDAKQTVTNMKDFTDEAFKDGIVDRQEAAAIEKYLNSIKSIQKSVAESYSKVYGNPLLSGTAKVELKTAYDGFNVATTELITAIDDAIADGVATSTEVALVDGRYDTFNTKYGDFIAYLNAANNFIQDKINTSAEDAKKAAEEAQKAADAAKAEAEAAKQRLDKWAEDGVISPTEKQSIKDEIVRIDADKTNITAGYTLYSLGSPTGYLNAHSNYRAVLVTLSASTPENITIPSDFASKQSAYYNQRTAALNAISDAAKAAVDTVKKDLAGYEYLKKAWKESTTIEGGVIQNALNMLGYTDPVAGFKVMSGMNGVYDATKVGGGIASWYGGSMKDRADYTEANMPSDVAKAIIRMDGSGYLASGAVWWGTDGVFHADPQSFIIKENQLGDYVSLFQIVYRSGTPKTISYMIPQYPMQKLTVSDYIEIGTTGYRIGVDSANNAIKVYKEDGSAVNFYASGAVSAKGISSGSGGGGGGLIDTVYGYSSLGGTFADSTLSDTFNAYTINKLASRITELEKNGGGGTGIAGIKVNNQTYAPDTNKYITLPNYPSTTITGTGNVLTNATYDNSTRVLTLTKGNIATTANHLERYAQITSTAIDTVSTFTASKTSVWEANGTAYGTTGANDTVLNIGSAANRLFQLRAAYNSDDFYFRGVGASSFRTWYKILHEGNYASALDSKYLKLSGGTLTGTLTVGDTLTSATVVTVKSSNATGTYIQFVNSTIPTVEVGYNATFGAYLYNDKLDSHPTLCLGMTDNVANGIVFRYSGANYNILHAGNYQNYMHNRFGTSGLIVYSSSSNEINFGGTYTANNYIFFGYTSKDNRPRPTEYHFGQNDASLHGKYFQSHIPTGTQPFQCVSTTTCTNLNADMVDGYHVNDLTKRVFINGIPGGAGSKWIRIGVLKYPSAGDSNTVMITISNSYSYSMNRSVTFIISLTHHSSKPIITQLNGYPAPFSKVRILAPKDSNGSYIYGDRYVDIYYFTSTASGASNVIYLTAINLNYNSTYHFVPNKNFVDGTTIPSNYDEIWNFPFTTGLGSNANIYSQDGSIEGGTLKLSSTSTFGETATFNGGMYSGNIFPLSNNNYRIGSFSNRFIDAYIQAWVYANSGLYMNPSGITQNGSYLELSSGGNEIIIAGGTDFHVNYRGASYGGRSVPKKWHWRAGSSSSWANMEFGDCTLHGWINSTGITGSGAKAYNVGARFANTSHDSIEIVGGNYTMGLGCHSNGLWHWWRGTANPTSSTNKSYVMEYDGSTWAFTGSITATAAITAKATSDFRLKENYDGLIDYRERLLKLGRVYDYNYNKKALDLYQDRIDNKRHTGLVYQNAVKAGITNFCHEKDEYGYGSLNYLSPDLIATIIGSVQANILSIRLVESEQERMRKELEHAKSEINKLKGLVASLQN